MPLIQKSGLMPKNIIGRLSIWSTSLLILVICGNSGASEPSDPAKIAKDEPVQTTVANGSTDSTRATREQPKVIEETVLGMNVTGNKELPNMLYIVPWKAKQPPLSEPSVQPLLREVFSTLDPDVFSRESDFYYQITESEAASQKQKNN